MRYFCCAILLLAACDPDAKKGKQFAELDDGGLVSLEDDDNWPSDWSAKESAVLDLVNQARQASASCGGQLMPTVSPLSMNKELQEAARLHALDMAENNYFSHTSQDGREFNDRIQAAGFKGNNIGENIAGGSRTAQEAFDSWMSSPGHCKNIMSNQFNVTGIGYATINASSFGHYWAQTFGRQ